MAQAATGDDAVPLVARLHPHRGPGLWYAALATGVGLGALAGVVTDLLGGHLVMAFVILLAGGGVAAFLGYLGAALLGPLLVVGPDGVQGRVSVRRPVDLRWPEVGVAVDPGGPRGRFQLDLGVERLELQPRTWVGFADLVLVLATTPAALERMDAPAIEELVRLLDVSGPSSSADLPEG